ncbi:MAG: EpsI family protein [Rhodocyclaceae bacterium]|nr:EpsI family protein [Rhodocyclaceae bacterium]
MIGTQGLFGLRFGVLPIRHAMLAAALLMAGAVFAWLLTPQLTAVQDVPDLERELPARFGEWRERPLPLLLVDVAVAGETNLNQPYDQVVMRAYENDRGQIVYLAVAWGKRQRQEVKVHRPDLCYVAQGYRVQALSTRRFDDIDSTIGSVTGKRMLALGRRGGEAVSYWMRIGALFSEDAWDTRLHILKEGLQGRIPDGVLVRASVAVRDEKEAQAAWPLAESFLRELTAASPERVRHVLLGWGGA